jgi:hypothetical protein
LIHKWDYHVATKAMTGNHGYHGETTGEGHYLPTVVSAPPSFVVVGSQSLIGKEFNHIL